MRPLAVERGIELASDMHGGLHRYVLADPQRFKQVALNLLSNAIKYNRPGGLVRTYFAETVPGQLRLLVVDTGHGLDSEAAARVFLPFERLAADATDVEGTGLGLTLSRSLAQAMGGKVDIAHTAPGEGSTFYFELPLAERPTVSPPASARLVAHPRMWKLGAARILYVEDNLSNLELVESILSRSPGIEVIPAMQGSLALELAARHDPDLVLLDLDLPDLSGEEVLRRLKADSRTESIPVIVLSADATPAQLRLMESEGIVAYLTKPLNISLFLDTLRTALGQGGFELMEAVTVILADDHPVFRDGLKSLLEGAGIVVLADVEDGRAALGAIREHRPQVAVIDLQLPDIDGATVIDFVRREHLPTRVLVLSARTDSAVVYRCIELGAAGYLPKLTAGDDICAAIRALARGESVVPPELQAGLASEIRLRRADDRPVLTPRELDIIRLAADGHSNAEIGLRLHVSTATVKTHLQHIFEKLEVSDRSAAVAQAFRRGLLA